MKNLKMSALVIGVFGIFLGISGCAPSGGGGGGGGSSSSGESTALEETWVSNCYPQELFGNTSYTISTTKIAGNSSTAELKTYSDDQCTQESSGFDFRSEGTFTLEDGDILDGKQLTKQTLSFTVKYSEGFFALFFPIGSTHTTVTQYYLDGDTKYFTDDYHDATNNNEYVPPTKIEYDRYDVKQ